MFGSDLPKWVEELCAIGGLLFVIAIVLHRLPKVDVGHSLAFRRRRLLNWLPLGLTYAFLYMGRYNLAAVKDIGAISQQEYGTIFGVGAAVYGISFLVNGPLTDRVGGRVTILIAALGSAVMNAALGVMTALGYLEGGALLAAILYGGNMYFQSFGAVSIVKVNASWFHLRERGVFGGIFGILISLGIYFAFDWGHMIVNAFPTEWVFFTPAIILAIFWTIDVFVVQATPSAAGFADFDAGDASSGDDGPPLPANQVLRRMLANPIILTIMAVEFCSGFLRNAIMHWYRDFAKAMSITEQFVYEHWGMLLCIAGITGGVIAGVISDKVFGSRRGPVAAVLYVIMLVGGVLMLPLLSTPLAIGYVVVVMSMAIIGVHGMLSGTASADFGGKKNAGTAVGIIDGAVYLGTVLQSFVLGYALPEKGTAAAKDIDNWRVWPIAIIAAAAVGLVLATRIWNAKPTPRAYAK
jgi:OPA family glycerol-3-phosphate transporter-like MFS transporter